MRGSDGRILIEGFYDNVRVLSDSEKAQIDSIPLFIREGGSVPILSLFLEHLGVYATCFGFGMNDEKFHAPDEFFRLKNFELGQRAYCKILHRLGIRSKNQTLSKGEKRMEETAPKCARCPYSYSDRFCNTVDGKISSFSDYIQH